MAKMEVDDVVDLSLGSGRDPALTITPATVRDLRALTQNSGLTITPAPPPPTSPSATSTIHPNTTATSLLGGGPGGGGGGGGSSGSSTPTTNNISTTITSVDPSTTSTPNNNNNANSGSNSSSTTNASNTNTTTTVATAGSEENKVQRRVLRPRTEPKSYAEAPDIVLLPARMNGGRQQNGNIDSETDDEEMPPYVPIKELTPAELKERENGLRILRDDLRNEETKLVLLKKLKQSQHVMKENIVVTPTSVSPTNPLAAIPAALTSKGALSVTPTTAVPLPAHAKSSRSNNSSNITSSVSIR